jgi:hypothetical protein
MAAWDAKELLVPQRAAAEQDAFQRLCPDAGAAPNGDAQTAAGTALREYSRLSLALLRPLLAQERFQLQRVL